MSSPAPSGTALAPDTDATVSTLTDATNSIASISAYAHALLNIVLTPATTPPPSWFGPLSTNLAAAQTHAQTWIETLGPAVSSTVPQAIINYSNLFTVATNDIVNILTESGGEPDEAQQKQITQLFNMILTELRSDKQTVLDIQTQLQTFSANIQTDHTNLVTGSNSALADVALDETTIATIQGQIAQVTADMAAQNAKALSSEIAIGVGIFIAIAAFALAVATAGATAPLLVGTVAVLGVGAAIGTAVVYSQKAADDLVKLTGLQSSLSDEQRQVVSLNALVASVNTIVTENEAAQTAMTAVLTTWSTLEGKLVSVLNDLQNNKYPLLIDIGTAQLAWSQLVTFATGMQTSLGGMTVQPVITPPAQTPMSAA